MDSVLSEEHRRGFEIPILTHDGLINPPQKRIVCRGGEAVSVSDALKIRLRLFLDDITGSAEGDRCSTGRNFVAPRVMYASIASRYALLVIRSQ